MKLKRAKAYRKLMGYLQVNFNFRQPYQVLVDEEILLDAVATKYDVVAGLERTLQGKVKPMVTQCTIEHLYRAKTPEAKEAIKIAKTFERRRCGHISREAATAGAQPPHDAANKPHGDADRPHGEAGAPASDKAPSADQAGADKPVKKPTPLSAFECLVEVVGPTNKHRYCVATQKPKLRQRMRAIAGVPLIYLSRSVMVLEPMSKSTEKMRSAIEEAKLVRGLNEVHAAPASEHSAGGRGPKKAKGPNPLSVKKRQRSESEQDEGSKKRRRGKRGGSHADKEHKESQDEASVRESPSLQDTAA